MIELVIYDSIEFKAQFLDISQSISRILQDNLVSIEHIGSTAIDGLIAKPYIDILCIVNNLNKSLILKQHDYCFKGELNIPMRYFFSKGKIKLHIVEKGHSLIEITTMFRDYLNENPNAKTQYAKLKLSLKKKDSKNIQGFREYTLGKNRFIKNILKLAGYDGLHIAFPLHFDEWHEYHLIKNDSIFKDLDIEYNKNHHSFTDKNHFHFVLYKGAKTIVSIAHIEIINASTIAIRSLATKNSYRRQGYGRYLLAAIEKWAKKVKSISCIKLHANIKAVYFYKKLGYIDSIFNDKSISNNIVDLEKKL